jgi:hypothetical protein
LQAAVDQMRCGNACRAPGLGVEQHFFGLGPGQQAHLIGLGDVLFVAGGAHVGRAPAVHQVDVAGAEAGHLHGHVDGGVAGAEHDAAVGQWQLVRSSAWRSSRM